MEYGYVLVPTVSLCPSNPPFPFVRYDPMVCCQPYCSSYAQQGVVYEDAPCRENSSTHCSVIPPFMHMTDQYRRNLEYGTLGSCPISMSPGAENDLYKMIPPPPSFPIINPIVYSNNCDVGTEDLEYISASDFRLLNTRTTPSISIPRPSPPMYHLSPQNLIPSLIRPSSVKGREDLKGDPFRLNSPSSMYVSSSSDTKMNNDKLFVIGFTWNPEPVREAFEDDPWII